MRKLFSIQILILTILLTACGGGGGGSSSTGTSGSKYKFKTEDLDSTEGRWFSTSFVVNGEETVPYFYSKIQMDVDSSGEWSLQLQYYDSNNNTVTEVSDSSNPTSADYEVTSFSYVINPEGSIILTEKFKVKKTGLEQTVSTTIIKDEVSSKYVGYFYLASTSNGISSTLTNTYTDILYIESNGTITDSASELNGTNKVTSVGHGAIQDGHVFFYYTNNNLNIVGESSISGNTLTISANDKGGDTITTVWKKITGGVLAGEYVLKKFTYEDNTGAVFSTSNSNTLATGNMTLTTDGERDGSYSVSVNNVQAIAINFDNQTYSVNGSNLNLTDSLGNTGTFQFKWTGTELEITENHTDASLTYVSVRTWQKVSDE